MCTYLRMCNMDNLWIFGGNFFATVLIFIITFLIAYFTTRRTYGVPSGPPLLPVIGNLLSLASKDLFGQLEKLRSQYGDIFALYVGNELMIFLNSHEVIHEALIKKGSQFVRRPWSKFHEIVVKDPVIIFANGDIWKGQRTFVQKAIQELCFKGKGQIDQIICTEGAHLVKQLENIGDSFDIKDHMIISSVNVIGTLLFHHRFEYGDAEILKNIDRISVSARETLWLQTLTNCFPYLFKLPGDIMGLKKFDKKFYFDVMDDLEKYLQYNKYNQNTILGLYQTRIDEERDNENIETSFTDFHRHKLCFELIGTGTETTSTTFRWILLYLLRNPDIQEKMYEEIERELGQEGLPSLADKTKLPYVHAVILETLRIANVAPLAVPHSPSKDLIFRGYLFPRNCTVMINLYSASHDPNVWEKPDEFIPERFLNEDQTEVLVPKEFIPFSLGPRSCLGETLARAELFLITTMLVQRFQFLPEKDGVIPDIDGDLGLTWSPKPFKLRVKCRKSATSDKAENRTKISEARLRI